MKCTGWIASTMVLGMTAACAMDEESDIGWEAFKAEAYQDPETGAYVIDGDVLVETEDQLRAFYEEWQADQNLPEGVGRQTQGLTINRVNGRDDRLTAARAADITFCVSRTSFGNRYSATVTAMNNAAAAWEAASGVNYTHRPEFDGNCNAGQTGVFFDVRQVSNAPFTARAFLPSSSRANRNVLIDTTAFGLTGRITLTGVLRHELGHTLGFRHEHIRAPSLPTICSFEDTQWRAITAYDSSSIMHYPQCFGTQSGDLVLTGLDRQGAAAIYGP